MEQNEKNCQKAQELTKEELEQVNGGSLFRIPKPKKRYVKWTVSALIAADQPRTAGGQAWALLSCPLVA